MKKIRNLVEEDRQKAEGTSANAPFIPLSLLCFNRRVCSSAIDRGTSKNDTDLILLCDCLKTLSIISKISPIVPSYLS